MLMIGVMPLPALMKSSFSGSRVGEHEGAFDAAEPDDVPGPGARAPGRRDLAGLDQLRGDRDAAVGAAGVGGQRVGAPVVDAVDDDADPQVLARPVARPLVAGADQHRAASAVSGSIRSIRPRSSRVDQSGLISSR